MPSSCELKCLGEPGPESADRPATLPNQHVGQRVLLHVPSGHPRREKCPNTFGCCRATACPWGRITVSTLVTAQPDDGEIRRLYDAINSEKVLAEFDAEAGKWGHCEGVALSQYDQLVHDWLDRVLVS